MRDCMCAGQASGSGMRVRHASCGAVAGSRARPFLGLSSDVFSLLAAVFPMGYVYLTNISTVWQNINMYFSVSARLRYLHARVSGVCVCVRVVAGNVVQYSTVAVLLFLVFFILSTCVCVCECERVYRISTSVASRMIGRVVCMLY